MEEGEKICFRTSEVLNISQREQWLKEAQMIRRKWIIFTFLGI